MSWLVDQLSACICPPVSTLEYHTNEWYLNIVYIFLCTQIKVMFKAVSLGHPLSANLFIIA